MKKFLAVALTMLVVSCTTYIPPAPKANYSYKQYPVQNLNVGSIQVVEAYSSPMKLPNVEHLMPDPLPHAVADWARTRFKANGGAGTLTITITNASVIRQDLPTHQGVTGWFNVDQSDRFEGKVDVNFSVDGVASGQSGTGAVNVARSQTSGEDTSVEDRDIAWTKMAEGMITDLDAGTQKMLQDRLPFLATK